MVGFDLGPPLQGQMRIAKLKSAYNSLIIGPRGLQCETNLWEIHYHILFEYNFVTYRAINFS